ncbi:MAG: site-2 protease family protein [Clostridiales bacterium]|nr:site-2 protease family protein [Clostridiales bacterium]
MLNNILIAPLQILYNLPAIIVAFTIHEFMHAYVAYKAGDDTPKIQGRLTLNPLKHIDPIGFIMVILIGFGWAKPVQVNINNFKNGRRDYIYVTLAGVFGNFILAFIATTIFYFSGNLLINSEAAYSIVRAFIYINLMLLTFNLLPLPPLDGFNLLTTLVRFKNMKVIYTLKRYGFMIIILLSIVGVLGGYISGFSNLILKGFITFLSFIQGLVG